MISDITEVYIPSTGVPNTQKNDCESVNVSEHNLVHIFIYLLYTHIYS